MLYIRWLRLGMLFAIQLYSILTIAGGAEVAKPIDLYDPKVSVYRPMQKSQFLPKTYRTESRNKASVTPSLLRQPIAPKKDNKGPFSLPAMFQSHSGGADGGGGDVIVCKNGFWIFGSSSIFLADTFQLKKKGLIHSLPQISETKMIHSAIKYFRQIDPASAARLENVLAFEITFNDLSDIGKLKDYEIAVDQKNCKRHQLAIQNLETGVVEYHRQYFLSLHPMERGLFKIHEALIRIRNRPGDTTDVRKRVAEILESDAISKIITEVIQEEKSAEYSDESKRRIVRNSIVLFYKGQGCIYWTNVNDLPSFLKYNPTQYVADCRLDPYRARHLLINDLKRLMVDIINEPELNQQLDKSENFDQFITTILAQLIWPSKN